LIDVGNAVFLYVGVPIPFSKLNAVEPLPAMDTLKTVFDILTTQCHLPTKLARENVLNACFVAAGARPAFLPEARFCSIRTGQCVYAYFMSSHFLTLMRRLGPICTAFSQHEGQQIVVVYNSNLVSKVPKRFAPPARVDTLRLLDDAGQKRIGRILGYGTATIGPSTYLDSRRKVLYVSIRVKHDLLTKNRWIDVMLYYDDPHNKRAYALADERAQNMQAVIDAIRPGGTVRVDTAVSSFNKRKLP
jgi:hypothetical protein